MHISVLLLTPNHTHLVVFKSITHVSMGNSSYDRVSQLQSSCAYFPDLWRGVWDVTAGDGLEEQKELVMLTSNYLSQA